MHKLLIVLFILASCTHGGLPGAQPQDRIIISERGSITGGHSLIVTPDDRVIYDGYGTDIAPATPGWRWLDPSQMTGQASITAPGAYARALGLLQTSARANRPNASAPVTPSCRNATEGSILLSRDGDPLFTRVAGSCLHSAPAGSAAAGYLSDFNTLTQSLRQAILPPDWLAR